MTRLVQRRRGSAREPTIALINIIFLMLVFFMIAGTLAPPLDPDLALVRTEGLEGREPPDTLVVHADGRMTLRGRTIASARAFVDTLSDDMRSGAIRIVPDRELPASELVRIAAELKASGAGAVMVVTERALQ